MSMIHLLLMELIHEDIAFESLSIFKSIIPGIQAVDKKPEFPVFCKYEDLYTK